MCVHASVVVSVAGRLLGELFVVSITRLCVQYLWPHSHPPFGNNTHTHTHTHTHIVSAPDPHMTPARKRVWYLTSAFLVVLSQHVNVNYVNNHVIEYQFASSISGLPVSACVCRVGTTFMSHEVSNPAI